jgi:predicted nucleotidyltransferase
MVDKTGDEIFNKLLEEAKNDPDIIGFFLGGSRAKGFETEYSDYDIFVVVKDDKFKHFLEKYAKIKHFDIDLMVFTFDGFIDDANWETECYARYNYAHLKILIDKTGQMQKYADEKGKVPKDKVESFIKAQLDGYINYLYRSLKCHRGNDLTAARLEAAVSIPYFFDVIFAIHDRRLRPYYKYLEWELTEFPLKKFPMEPKELLNAISRILDDADIKTQQKLLRISEEMFRGEGHGEVFDSWEEDLDWMKTYGTEDD